MCEQMSNTICWNDGVDQEIEIPRREATQTSCLLEDISGLPGRGARDQERRITSRGEMVFLWKLERRGLPKS